MHLLLWFLTTKKTDCEIRYIKKEQTTKNKQEKKKSKENKVLSGEKWLWPSGWALVWVPQWHGCCQTSCRIRRALPPASPTACGCPHSSCHNTHTTDDPCHQNTHVDVHTVAVTTHTPLMTRAIKITTHTTKYPCHQLPWLREDDHAIAVIKCTHHWQPVPPKQQHGPQVTYEYDIKTRRHATDDLWHQNNTHQWWPMTSKQQHTPLMTYDIKTKTTPLMTYDIKTTTHTTNDLWHQNKNYTTDDLWHQDNNTCCKWPIPPKKTAKQHTSPMTQASKTTHHQWLRPPKQHTSSMTQASKTTHIINDSGLQNNTHHKRLRPPKQHTSQTDRHKNPKLAASIQNKDHNVPEAFLKNRNVHQWHVDWTPVHHANLVNHCLV